MRHKLTIELLSDTCPGSGLGHAGVIDRDFVADKFGLPFLPGRRLKGLLRDAYVDVAHYKTNLPTPEELFGKGGDKSPGPIDTGDARLDNYDRLRDWLIAAGAGRYATVFRNDVIDAFSAVRRQNAHDRRTGATLEDYFRLTRVIRSGHCFEVHLRCPDQYETGLSDAAKALKQMGTSRTRGLGHVQCKLNADNDSPSPIRGVAIVQAGRLHFRIRLERPAIFPHAAGDPNTIVSRDYIPGSALLGLLAANWEKNDRFYQAFFAESTRFLNAYPVSKGRRCIPTPNFIRQVKASQTEFINVAKDWGSDPLRRVGGWCQGSIVTDSNGYRAEVAMGFSYHNQRSDDRRIGRAIAGEAAERPAAHKTASPGAFFAYEAIEEGQEFEGAIFGEEDTLRSLANSLAQLSSEGLFLGRARNAGYGGNVKWEWLGDHENVREPTGRELSGWQDVSDGTDTDPELDRFLVTLLSPVSWFNDCGHPCPIFPWSQLEERLNRVRLTVESAFTRTRMHGGFLAHQQMQRQQLPCLEMGSAFLVSAGKALKLSLLRSAERQSYGVRKEEGFGRIAIDPLPENEPKLQRESAGSPTDAVLTGTDDKAYPLAKALFQSAILKEAKNQARKKASDDEQYAVRAPASQLSRLLQIVNSNNLQGALTMVGDLKETSRKRLGSIHTNVSEALFQMDKLYESFHNAVFNHQSRKWNNVFQETGSPCSGFDGQVIRTYLITYVRTLIEGNRAKGN